MLCWHNKSLKTKQTAAPPDTIIAPHTQCNALEHIAFKHANESMQFGVDSYIFRSATIVHQWGHCWPLEKPHLMGLMGLVPSMPSLQTRNQSHWLVVVPASKHSEHPLFGSGNHNLVACFTFHSLTGGAAGCQLASGQLVGRTWSDLAHWEAVKRGRLASLYVVLICTQRR